MSIKIYFRKINKINSFPRFNPQSYRKKSSSNHSLFRTIDSSEKKRNENIFAVFFYMFWQHSINISNRTLPSYPPDKPHSINPKRNFLKIMEVSFMTWAFHVKIEKKKTNLAACFGWNSVWILRFFLVFD